MIDGYECLAKANLTASVYVS